MKQTHTEILYTGFKSSKINNIYSLKTARVYCGMYSVEQWSNSNWSDENCQAEILILIKTSTSILVGTIRFNMWRLDDKSQHRYITISAVQWSARTLKCDTPYARVSNGLQRLYNLYFIFYHFRIQLRGGIYW